MQVFPDKRALKLLKSHSLNVNWYQYCPETAVMLLSTTVQANVLQPFAFRVRPCERHAALTRPHLAAAAASNSARVCVCARKSGRERLQDVQI